MNLKDEIKQRKLFASLRQEAHLGVLRTAAEADHAFAEALKPHGITPTQYNVLRILRGAGDAGLCRHEVRDRLVAKVPDVTRLLDRMEQAGWVERARGSEDRRVVTTRITPAGTRLLAALDEPVAEIHARQFAYLAPEQLQTLVDLLALARQGE